MRTTIMPPPAAPENLDLPDSITPASLAALDITDAEDLWVDYLPDETEEERAARLTAGADILHDRLSEIALHALSPIDDFLVEPLYDHEHGLSAGLEDAAAQISARVESWSQEVAA